MIFGVKIEGKLAPVTSKLSYGQADALAAFLEPFRNASIIMRAFQGTGVSRFDPTFAVWGPRAYLREGASR